MDVLALDNYHTNCFLWQQLMPINLYVDRGNRMRKTFIILCIFCASLFSEASQAAFNKYTSITCIGHENSKPWAVSLIVKANILIITNEDSDSLTYKVERIVEKNGDSMAFTEKYTTDIGTQVYSGFGLFKNGGAMIVQFDGATNRPTEYINLQCHKREN